MLLSKFSPEEIKRIKPLQELVDLCANPKDIEYKHFIALINAIMSGIDNAKLIASHESKRIQKINDIIDSLVKSRAK